MKRLKTIISYTIYVLLLTVFIACKKEKSTSRTGKILEGKHKLRRFKTSTEEGYRWSASYFLISGGASGETYKDTKASFSWEMNTGEYAISEIELGKIRIKIDSTVTEPYITFNWSRDRSSDIEYIFKWRLNYMLITCKEEDYLINIDLTQL